MVAEVKAAKNQNEKLWIENQENKKSIINLKKEYAELKEKYVKSLSIDTDIETSIN